MAEASKQFLPGATIGMLGGGQLGRMSILAGRHMGYRFHVYEPSPYCAAAAVADRHWACRWEDEDALESFARSVDVITLEFENIPAHIINHLEKWAPVRPAQQVLHICQNRRREKEFLRSHGFPCADFRVVTSAAELKAAVAEIGVPCVLKTADFGYDGKGQLKLETDNQDWETLWNQLGYPTGVLEAWVSFQAECSVIVARNGRESKVFPAAVNCHRHHILHTSSVPANLPDKVLNEAEQLALALAESLEVVGLLAVECFVTAGGKVLVNELAPRPHNSGHYTIDSCQTSQFEQHIRAVCGLPLGNPRLNRPVVMVNLLGDQWKGGQAPDWSRLLADPDVTLHLYDKGEPRRGRKMGHFCVLADTLAEAEQKAATYFAQLQ